MCHRVDQASRKIGAGAEVAIEKHVADEEEECAGDAAEPGDTVRAIRGVESHEECLRRILRTAGSEDYASVRPGAGLKKTWRMIRRITPQFFTTEISGTLAYYKDKLGFESVGTCQDPPVYACVDGDEHAINFRC